MVHFIANRPSTCQNQGTLVQYCLDFTLHCPGIYNAGIFVTSWVVCSHFQLKFNPKSSLNLGEDLWPSSCACSQITKSCRQTLKRFVIVELSWSPTGWMLERSIIFVLLSTQLSEKHHSRYLAVHKGQIACLPLSWAPASRRQTFSLVSG